MIKSKSDFMTATSLHNDKITSFKYFGTTDVAFFSRQLFLDQETEFESEFLSGMYLLQESATWCKIGHFWFRTSKTKK